MNSEVLLDRNFKRAVLTEIRDYRSLIDLKPKLFAVTRRNVNKRGNEDIHPSKPSSNSDGNLRPPRVIEMLCRTLGE